MNQLLVLVSFTIVAFAVQAKTVTVEKKAVLSDIKLLKELNIPLLAEKTHLNIGLAMVTPEQEAQLSARAHEAGRCGGYEAVQLKKSFKPGYDELFAHIEKRQRKFTNPAVKIEYRHEISKAVSQVDEARIRGWVEWLSSFHTRFHASAEANAHTVQLKEKIEQFLAKSKLKSKVEFINHQRTRQYSLRVRLEGSKRPNEIVVLGGHYDSINQMIFDTRAPGADDNASGSASLLEALRILSEGEQPERTIEFMWYAAEEVGLYGSSEIAQEYRQNNLDVIGVLQLDMTLHPGEGELVLASMTDFTSPWLRDVFSQLNTHYVGAKILDDQCGYGCSDHASWFRQGYATVMPFEATMRTMNKKIHSRDDVINAKSNFKHAAGFAKAAVAFALELGNSEIRE